jgi:serine/threonine protein kinase
MVVKFSSHRDSENGSEAFLAAQAVSTRVHVTFAPLTEPFHIYVQSMKHELRILTQLKHGNVCSLWGYEEDTFGSPRMPAIVTELCTNGTLKEVRGTQVK